MTGIVRAELIKYYRVDLSQSFVVSFNLSLDVKHSRREVCHPISGAAISRGAWRQLNT